MESAFRLCAKKVFLTYSQCPLERDELLQVLTARCGKLREYFIAREHHEDGNPHLHCAIHAEKRMDTRDERFFDLKGYHPNIRTLKSIKDWETRINYMKKEDPDPVCQLESTVKEAKNKEIYEMLMKEGPDKLLMSNKISPFSYTQLKRTYVEHKSYLDAQKWTEKEDLPSTLENPWNLTLNVNLDVKKCHYWLFSSVPNVGKTTWAQTLMTKYRAESWNYSEDFQPQLLASTEVILMDEFRGQLRITQINSLCDGTMWLKAKGAPAWKLTQKPLVIVLSNKSIQEVYKNSDTSLVEARFTEIYLSPGDLIKDPLS